MRVVIAEKVFKVRGQGQSYDSKAKSPKWMTGNSLIWYMRR